jgi:hypothetical protein
VQGRGVNGSFEATIPETDRTIQGYSNQAVARSKYPPNTHRVGCILSRLIQELRTRQYSFLNHSHDSHCLAESRSLLWEALWSKHPGRDSPDCTLPWGLRPRLILLQSAVAPNGLWIMQPLKFSSRSDKSRSTPIAATRDTGYAPSSYRSAYFPKYCRFIHLITDMNYRKGYQPYKQWMYVLSYTIL